MTWLGLGPSDPARNALNPERNAPWPWWKSGTFGVLVGLLFPIVGSVAVDGWSSEKINDYGWLDVLVFCLIVAVLGVGALRNLGRDVGHGLLAVLVGVYFFSAGFRDPSPGGLWLLMFWGVTSFGAFRLGRGDGVYIRVLLPAILGWAILGAWELLVYIYDVSPVILPAPSAIAVAFAQNTDVLWADFVQTILRGALVGYLIGCGAACVVALAVDRSLFLQRGLLPVGSFLAAMPIVGTAPIFVMWLGFGPSSKVAVVVAMVFFPMLVNAVQGLKASDVMQRDLMHTYAASYWQSLWKLRVPTALPFVFNGLKICTTLALIGAIVAEFFGSPTVGMGFRIKIEMGRLAIDMVWAEITVAALAGTGFYGLMTLLERRLTFWHPSQRR